MAEATTYTLTGPTTGKAGDVLTYTVSIGSDTHAGVTITPAASVATSGTFSPATVTLTTAAPTATFTFTPSKLSNANNISTTSSPSLSNPSAVALTVTGDVTLSGPASLSPGVATAYEVEITTSGTFSGNVVVTPAGPAGWTFTPATVTLTNAARKKSFAVTADQAESGTLSVTTDQAFAVPAAGLDLAAAFSTTSFQTTVKNVSGVEKYFPFLGRRGLRLAAGASYSFFGGIETILSMNGFPNERDFRDFERAVKDNALEVLATPAVIITDAATQATKVLTLVNGTVGAGDPSYGPNSEL